MSVRKCIRPLMMVTTAPKSRLQLPASRISGDLMLFHQPVCLVASSKASSHTPVALRSLAKLARESNETTADQSTDRTRLPGKSIARHTAVKYTGTWSGDFACCCCCLKNLATTCRGEMGLPPAEWVIGLWKIINEKKTSRWSAPRRSGEGLRSTERTMVRRSVATTTKGDRVRGGGARKGETQRTTC